MAEIVESEAVLDEKPRIEGTRVSAEQVYEMHTLKEMTPTEIANILRSVDVEGVETAIRFMRKCEASETDVPI